MRMENWAFQKLLSVAELVGGGPLAAAVPAL